MNMKRIIALLLMLAFLLCGCGKNGKNGAGEEEINESNTLYLTGYNFSSANPLDVKNNVNKDIFGICYQSLYKTSENGESIPCLALNCEESENGMRMSVTLRNDVTFHNGKPFSATDVVYTVNYIKNLWILCSIEMYGLTVCTNTLLPNA